MKDSLGKILMKWRIRGVIPHVKGRLLDVGCGTNELVKTYRGEGVGVDVYRWENVDVVVEDTSKLPFESETFDSVAIVAALNHIPNRSEVLTEIHRLLRPDGRIVVTMIPPGISRAWHFLRKPWDADQNERGMRSGEVFGFTKEEIHRLLSQAGFSVLFERKFMFGINRITVAKALKSTTTELATNNNTKPPKI